MDIYASISNYITKMVSAGDSGTSGGAAKMKMLLLDRDTVRDSAPGARTQANVARSPSFPLPLRSQPC